MTLQLKFDKNNRKKLISHLQWLKEVGVISSFDLDEDTNGIEISDEELNEMKQAASDVKKGNFISHEDVKKRFQ